MKIIVCLKAVPRSVIRVKVAATKDRAECESDALVLNESDEYALEEASVIKRQNGGELVALTLGPLPAQCVLQTGLAKGADRAVRVGAQFGDAERTSTALAEAIKKIGGYDLILTGVESKDNLASEVGVRIAEKLQLPYAYAVSGIELGGSPGVVKVTKEVGGGLRQVLETKLPALLCVQQGIRPLSYVPLRNLLQAQRKPVECFSPEDLGLSEGAGSKLEIVEVFRPTETHRAEMIEGKPPEVAHKLLEIMRRF